MRVFREKHTMIETEDKSIDLIPSARNSQGGKTGGPLGNKNYEPGEPGGERESG